MTFSKLKQSIYFLGLTFFFCIHSTLLNAQATLSTGDVVIIGFTGDSQDAFAWVNLVALSAGETIYFTNTGYFSGDFGGGGTFGQLIKYVAPGAVAAGTIHLVTDDGSAGGNNENSAPYSTVAISGFSSGSDLSIPSGGDQLLAFQSTDAESAGFTDINFTPLFAVAGHASAWGNHNSNFGTESELYPGLTDGVNAVAAGRQSDGDVNNGSDEWDNVRYTGITTGTKAQILAAVALASNWEGTDSNPSPDSWPKDGLSGATSFTINAATDPVTASITSQTDVLCNGDATGSLTVTASDGTTPYTYSWSSGGNTATVSTLSAGTYTVTVTDGSGGTSTATATITQPNALDPGVVLTN